VAESWLQLSVRTSAANIDAASNFLIERGSPGVVVKRYGLDAFFPANGAAASLKKDVQRFFVALSRLSSRADKARLNWKVVEAENWNNSWKRFIKPRRVGKSFWVTPPWLEPPKFRRRRVITIEPGMAFGTGTHATTRGCLEFLEVAADRLHDDKFTALDVGTGSGILAIALDKLGAREVWAIDNDPVALKVARENLIVNQAAEKVHLTGKNLSAIRKTFSLVVANLTAETILELAEALERKVARKGFLILSGILQKRVSAVTRRFAARFRTVKRKRAREWAILLLQRK
jgi:ribosomal protein L11 methyltransferase